MGWSENWESHANGTEVTTIGWSSDEAMPPFVFSNGSSKWAGYDGQFFIGDMYRTLTEDGDLTYDWLCDVGSVIVKKNGVTVASHDYLNPTGTNTITGWTNGDVLRFEFSDDGGNVGVDNLNFTGSGSNYNITVTDSVANTFTTRPDVTVDPDTPGSKANAYTTLPAVAVNWSAPAVVDGKTQPKTTLPAVAVGWSIDVAGSVAKLTTTAPAVAVGWSIDVAGSIAKTYSKRPNVRISTEVFVENSKAYTKTTLPAVTVNFGVSAVDSVAATKTTLPDVVAGITADVVSSVAATKTTLPAVTVAWAVVPVDSVSNTFTTRPDVRPSHYPATLPRRNPLSHSHVFLGSRNPCQPITK